MARHKKTLVRTSQAVDKGMAYDCKPCGHVGSIFADRAKAEAEYLRHTTTGQVQRDGRWL